MTKAFCVNVICILYDPISPLHSGSEQPRIGMEALSNWFVRLLVCMHGSLICLLHTACFARALCCPHLFTCLLALSLTPDLLEKKLAQRSRLLNHSAISGTTGCFDPSFFAFPSTDNCESRRNTILLFWAFLGEWRRNGSRVSRGATGHSRQSKFTAWFMV